MFVLKNIHRRFYCGIGSRQAPESILEFMTKIASILEQCNYILRSGKAKGSDSFFEKGVKSSKNKEIFTSRDALPWAYETVKQYLPNDRPATFDSWQPFIRGLLARNMMQVLGKTGAEPVAFVVCWTPQGDYSSSDIGGTGYALRCAIAQGIPTYNLNYPDQMQAFKELVRKIFKSHQNS